jgi:hypothetical protein
MKGKQIRFLQKQTSKEKENKNIWGRWFKVTTKNERNVKYAIQSGMVYEVK